VAKRAQELKGAESQASAHNKNGGSTFHPTKGDLAGKPHFAVGGEPEFKRAELKMTTDGKNLTPAQLGDFSKRAAVKEALDKHKDASVGSWYDKDTDKTTTELVKTPSSREDAIKMGQKNGEKAIYDLGKGEEIKTERRTNLRLAKDIAEWKPDPNLGAFSAEDAGAKVRAKNPEPKGRGTTEPERRSAHRAVQAADDKIFTQARKELGEDASTDDVDKRVLEIKNEASEVLAKKWDKEAKEKK
jgi:hypothetical protein